MGQSVSTKTYNYTNQYIGNGSGTETINIPNGCIAIDIILISCGGSYGTKNGNYYGGSGSGGCTIVSNNKIPITYGNTLTLSYSNTSYTSANPHAYELKINNASLCKIYNGLSGGNATSSSGGTAGSSNTASPYYDAAYGSWSVLYGSAGSAGSTSIPASAGVPKGRIFSDGNYGCGQRSSSTALGVGVLYLSFYFV
jgi:hypothetical protein